MYHSPAVLSAPAQLHDATAPPPYPASGFAPFSVFPAPVGGGGGVELHDVGAFDVGCCDPGDFGDNGSCGSGGD